MNIKKIIPGYKRAMTVLTLLIAALPVLALTPADVLGNAVSRIQNSKAVACRFKVSGNAGAVTGDLLSAGSRFSIVSPSVSTWFDGKTMWTANASTREVTVTNPTREEIAETNPLSYLTGYRSDYRLFFSKRTDAANHLVLLNPRKKGTGIKAIEIAINKKSYAPVRMVIRFDDDRRAEVSISGLSYNVDASAASFTFPSQKYKGFEIVDLR